MSILCALNSGIAYKDGVEKKTHRIGNKEPKNAIQENETQSGQRSPSLVIIAADIFCTSYGQYKHVATEGRFARADAPRQKNDTGSFV